MKNKDPKLRKNVLFINTDTFISETGLRELLNIRGDFKIISEKIDAFEDYDKVCQLMAKKKCAFGVSGFKEYLTFIRTFDHQPLECIKFKILNCKSSSEFKCIPAEMFVKYMVLTQNLPNKKLENLFIDLFHQKTVKIDPEALKYAWILNEFNGVFTLKFVRILKDQSVQDIGPYLEMQIEKEFYCGDELYEQAFEITKPRVQKNVTTNATKDKIGKLYVDKQDLKDINLKKSRAYKK